MIDLIEYIVRSIVADPTQVEISEQHRGSTITYQLQVAKEDMGRVIGKGGRIAKSIRVLLRVAAIRSGKKVSLDIIEPK